MLKVTRVTPLDGYTLEIEFNDGGRARRRLLLPTARNARRAIEDLDYFRQARVDDDARTIGWPNGLDPAPELLHGGEESIRALGRQRPAA